jgi:NADH:ubiquinone oxidoreductase subunit 2 (subunit N)
MVPDYDHHADLLEINGLVPSSKHSSCRLTHALLSLIGLPPKKSTVC